MHTGTVSDSAKSDSNFSFPSFILHL